MIRKLLQAVGLAQPDPNAKPKPVEARSPQWSKVRALHLKREPRCAICGTDKQLEVHHIWPFGWPGGSKFELDDGKNGTGLDGNLITLCESPSHNCHLWGGHLGDWHSRNATIRTDAPVMLAKIKNRPRPPTETITP